MALIYRDVAIVSVGMSCQAAAQIYAAKPALDAIAGEVSERHHTPMDWLIARPEHAAALFHSGRFLPERPGDLFWQAGRFCWREAGIWYWHEPRANANFDTLRDKFAHTTAMLESLRDKNVLAVWTNGQRNLASVSAEFGATSPVVGRAQIERLRATVQEFFPRCTFWPVFSPADFDPRDPVAPGGHAIYDNAADAPSDWIGNAAVWQPLLEAAFRAHIAAGAAAPADRAPTPGCHRHA